MASPAGSWYSGPIPLWATDTAQGLAAQTVETATHLGPPPGLDHANQRILAALQSVGRTAHADAQLAATFGIELANPFLDSQVVDAVLSTEAWRHTSPFEYKPLLRQAVGDLLPSEVANRSTKGTYQSDHYLGLRANLETLAELCDGELSKLGLVDKKPLLQQLDWSAKGLPVEVSAVEPALAVEAWIRSVQAAPAVVWRAEARARETN